jgi:hypothetical protein
VTAPLSDDFPVLLGPVRVETRFTATELLVRVFPDEWAVDKFEPKPTAAEISALDAYWTARWAAGNDTAEPLQAAWQELTGRVPAGRASWLLQTRVPANPADEPAGRARRHRGAGRRHRRRRPPRRTTGADGHLLDRGLARARRPEAAAAGRRRTAGRGRRPPGPPRSAAAVRPEWTPPPR